MGINVVIAVDSSGSGVPLTYPIAGVARLKRRVCTVLRCAAVNNVFLIVWRNTNAKAQWSAQLQSHDHRIHWLELSEEWNDETERMLTRRLGDMPVCVLNADVFEPADLAHSVFQFEALSETTVTFLNKRNKEVWRFIAANEAGLLYRTVTNNADGEMRVEYIEEDAFVSSDTPDAFQAEKWLRQNMGRPGDGMISKYVNRPISTQLTWRISRWPIHPNVVSVFTILVGLAAAFLNLCDKSFLLILGAVLFYVSSILDGCDGELARLRCEESSRGAWLDNIGDCVVVTVYLLTLGVGTGFRSGELATAFASIVGFISVWCGLLYWWAVMRTLGVGSMSVLRQKMNANSDMAVQRIKWYQIFYRREYITLMVAVGVWCGFQNWVIWIASFNSVLFLMATIIFRTSIVQIERKIS